MRSTRRESETSYDYDNVESMDCKEKKGSS